MVEIQWTKSVPFRRLGHCAVQRWDKFTVKIWKLADTRRSLDNGAVEWPTFIDRQIYTGCSENKQPNISPSYTKAIDSLSSWEFHFSIVSFLEGDARVLPISYVFRKEIQERALPFGYPVAQNRENILRPLCEYADFPFSFSTFPRILSISRYFATSDVSIPCRLERLFSKYQSREGIKPGLLFWST